MLFFDSINEAVRTPQHTASSGRIMAINELDSTLTWPLSDLRHYPTTFLDTLGKTAKTSTRTVRLRAGVQTYVGFPEINSPYAKHI